VVARRLRQAAQQETDPELKEKLWQEYIDYKKNAQGK
jgi:chorismate mutase